MEQMQRIVKASVLYRALFALCLWFGRQWQGSGIIQWFIHPPLRLERAESESSVFTRLWRWVHRGLCRIYEVLHLRRLFAGSVFQKCWLWAGAAAVLAPILPTMAVLGLMLVSCFSLLLLVMERRDLELFYTPYNRYIWMYAAIYLVGTWFSVTPVGQPAGRVPDGGFHPLCPGAGELHHHPAAAGQPADAHGNCRYGGGPVRGVPVPVRLGLPVGGLGGQRYVRQCFPGALYFREPQHAGAIPDPGHSSGRGRTAVCQELGQAGLLLLLLRHYVRLHAAYDVPGGLAGTAVCGICLCAVFTAPDSAACPAAAGALYFVMPDLVITRFTSIGNLEDQSTSYRVYIWMGTLAMLKDYWLCGIGPGDAAFNLVYPRYSYSGITAPHSHNLFLQIMCDAGVIALVIFVLLLFHFFRDVCSAFCRERDAFSRFHQTAVAAGMAGFLVQAMTDYSFYNYRVMFLFWVFIALGGLLARRGQLPERGGTCDPSNEHHQ